MIMYNENRKWKVPLFDENNNVQKIRILRPKEAFALIDHIDVKDEKTWRYLQDKDITSKDVQAWLKFLLLSGCRFSEMILIRNDPKLRQSNGTLRIPNYAGKEMRMVKARNVLLSDMGRSHLDTFFSSAKIPVQIGKENDMIEAMTSISTMMHIAGEKIGLETMEFDVKRKHRQIGEDGKPVKIKKITKDGREIEVYDKTTKIEQIETNGCSIRSTRKSWESWLIHSFGGEKIETQIFLSQGHTRETAMRYYLNTGYDEEDIVDIRKCTLGYGVMNQE